MHFLSWVFFISQCISMASFVFTACVATKGSKRVWLLIWASVSSYICIMFDVAIYASDWWGMALWFVVGVLIGLPIIKVYGWNSILD